MKKLRQKRERFLVRKQRKLQKEQIRASGIRRHRASLDKTTRAKHSEYFKTLARRSDLNRIVYRKRRYTQKETRVNIANQFGIEDENSREYFLDTAEQMIEFNAKKLSIDIQNCSRMWPTGIVLLCSLKQWVSLTSRQSEIPTIASTSPASSKVGDYLMHCGFNDYVGLPVVKPSEGYSPDGVVKIRKEMKKSNVEKREKEVLDLLRKYSVLDSVGIEWFDCVILTEVFNNVTEHGVSNYDGGWWLLAQYHPTHKMISICIADNGIGVRNSLTTGPQRDEIKSKFDNEPENDGDFIRLALEERVSGALDAPLKSGRFIKRYSPGAKRGNGLKTVRRRCKALQIPFAILSHNGFLFVSDAGEITSQGARARKIFAGTLYWFCVKAK